MTEKNFAEKYDALLQPYAQKNSESRGREYEEQVDPNRLPFQRDRDRVIHSQSFRRLQGKMQVVPTNFGDHYRNRLSHTVEVSQIARDMARTLGLNEDLSEVIALSHDLGHPPFGHSGEEALDKVMKNFRENFDHNSQSLRVVTSLERKYVDFPGLNLTFETLEGIQKHSTQFQREDESIFTPHLESQLVDIADEIAYLSADIEDGLRGEFFTIQEVVNLNTTFTDIEKEFTHESIKFIRHIMKKLLHQLIIDTKKNIKNHNINALSEAQKIREKIVNFQSENLAQIKKIKSFLFERYYLSPEIRKYRDKGMLITQELFDYFMKNPKQISRYADKENIPRQVCDYIAGMTDQFAFDIWKDKVGA